MKKPIEKLISTLFLLLIATAMMGTSTFAWFSMNNVVTASTMQIRAVSGNPYLKISNTELGVYSVSVSSMILSNDPENDALSLVTPLNLGTPEENPQYYIDDELQEAPEKFTDAASVLWGAAISYDPDVVYAEAVTSYIPEGELGFYVQKSELWFKVLLPDQKGYHLRISQITFDAGTSTIASSGRVLAVSEEGRYQLFKLVDGAVTASEDGSDNFLIDQVTTAPVKLTLFFFFDGTDDSAYTNNANDLSGVTAQFRFRVD